MHGGEPADSLHNGDGEPGDGSAGAEHSLIDDVSALYEDGKTYVQAEIAFQKTRAAFTVQKGKMGAIYGVAALMFAHLALVGLVVGLLLALSPLITPWGATAVVVLLLLALAAILGKMALGKFQRLSREFKETR